MQSSTLTSYHLGFNDSRTQYKLWVSVLLLGLLSAAYLPILEVGRWYTDDGLSLTPLIAILYSIIHWMRHTTRSLNWRDRVFFIGIGVLFLVPSAQWVWVLLLVGFSYLWWREEASLRPVLLACVLVALYQPSVHLLFKWFVGDVLTFDAWLVSSVLQLTHGVGSHTGNLIFGPADHQLLVLRGCSSIHNLGGIWLVWLAVRQVSHHQETNAATDGSKRHAAHWGRWFAFASILTIAWNLIRLYSMALSEQAHIWWHAEDGTLTYQVGLLAILALLVIRTRPRNYA